MGDLKEGWPRVKLVDVALNTTVASKDPVADGFERYIIGKHIPEESGQIRSWNPVGDAEFGSRIRTIFRAGDVICTTRGPNLKVAVPDFAGLSAHTNFILRTRKPDILLQPWLEAVVRSGGFQSHLRKHFRGSTNLFVNWSDAGRYEFALPPLEEQQSRLKVFAAAEAVRAELSAARDAAVQLRDRLRTNVFTEHSGRQKVGEVLEFITSGSRGWSKYYADEGAAFLRIGNLNSPTIELNTREVQRITAPDDAEAERTRVRRDDVLLGITGDAGVGLVGIVRDASLPTFVSQHVAVIRVDATRCCPQFLAHMLASPGGQRQIAKYNQPGAKAGMTLIAVRDLLFPNLPLIKQQEIGEQLSGLENAFSEIEGRLGGVVGLAGQARDTLLTDGPG